MGSAGGGTWAPGAGLTISPTSLIFCDTRRLTTTFCGFGVGFHPGGGSSGGAGSEYSGDIFCHFFALIWAHFADRCCIFRPGGPFLARDGPGGGGSALGGAGRLYSSDTFLYLESAVFCHFADLNCIFFPGGPFLAREGGGGGGRATGGTGTTPNGGDMSAIFPNISAELLDTDPT